MIVRINDSISNEYRSLEDAQAQGTSAEAELEVFKYIKGVITHKRVKKTSNRFHQLIQNFYTTFIEVNMIPRNEKESKVQWFI